MARDRYLWNSGEEAINKEGAEKKLQDRKSKWENFWYYHKLHVLITVICLAVVGGFIHEMVNREDPDYQIALLTQKGYSTDLVEALQGEIAKYGEDLNGDGKVLVQINPYTIVTGEGEQASDPSVQMAGVTRFSVDVQEGDSIIYITDDESFRNNQGTNRLFSYLDGSLPAESADDYENMRVPWEECKILSGLKPGQDQTALTPEGLQKALDSMKDLSVSLRVFEGTPLAEKKNMKEHYDASRRLFDKLVYDK